MGRLGDNEGISKKILKRTYKLRTHLYSDQKNTKEDARPLDVPEIVELAKSVKQIGKDYNVFVSDGRFPHKID